MTTGSSLSLFSLSLSLSLSLYRKEEQSGPALPPTRERAPAVRGVFLAPPTESRHRGLGYTLKAKLGRLTSAFPRNNAS